MKTLLGGCLIALALLAGLDQAGAQGTAFSYQGRLNVAGNPANGLYNVRFWVLDAATNGNLIAGPLTNSATGVTNGLFTATLDFGPGVFTGPPRWLEVDVRTNNAGVFTILSPLQQFFPVPYALIAGSASNIVSAIAASQIIGTIPLAQLPAVLVTNGPGGVNLTGTFSGNGAGLTNLMAAGGGLTWQYVTGTNQQAQPNKGYLADNPGQVTITLPASPNLGDIVRVSGVGSGAWVIAQNNGQSILASQFGIIATTNWNNLTNWVQTSAPIAGVNWDSIASSADGHYLVAVANYVFTSTNSGENWTEISSFGVNMQFVSSSQDGTKLAGVGYTFVGSSTVFVICTSTNSGIAWTINGAFQAPWHAVALSADGTKLVAVASGYEEPGGIYTSTDFGSSWTQTSAPIEYWGSVASSSNGTKLVAAASDYYGPGGIYTSTNGGGSWTLTSAPIEYWGSVASSSDGIKLVAADYGGDEGIYTSTNAGGNWALTSAPSEAWWDISSSADGSKLTAIVGFGLSGGIYISTNSGGNWILTGAPSEYWDSVASSADGTHLVAVGNRSGIYTANAAIQPASTTPGTAGYLKGAQSSAIELQYIGNSQWMPLSYVGTIFAH